MDLKSARNRSERRNRRTLSLWSTAAYWASETASIVTAADPDPDPETETDPEPETETEDTEGRLDPLHWSRWASLHATEQLWEKHAPVSHHQRNPKTGKKDREKTY